MVGHDTKLVATNVAATAPVTVAQGGPVPGHHGPAHAVLGPATHHHGKREAEAAAEPEAEAGVYAAAPLIGPHPAPAPAAVRETPLEISEPVCHSVPVKTCNNVPTHVPRYLLISPRAGYTCLCQARGPHGVRRARGRDDHRGLRGGDHHPVQPDAAERRARQQRRGYVTLYT